MKLRSVGISGLGSCLPDKILSNTDLEKIVDTNDEWIVSRTGISERRIADADTALSDICVVAAKRALEDAGVHAEELDLILVATVTPDFVFPSTACILQEKLGAKKAAALDIEAGCSGFLYGLAVGSQFIATGMYNKVLVIGGETLSKLLDMTDRGTCILFGDGAGAAVLSPVEDGNGFLSFVLGAQGQGGENLCVPAGGSRNPASEETIKNRQHFIKMSGNEVFKFAVRIMGEAAVQSLEKAGLSTKDVDVLIPHQANIRIIDAAMKRLDLDRDKVVVNLDKYGNMSAASIPVALDEAVKEGRIKNGDTLVMVGFGAGLTWGACTIKWAQNKEER
ncbi:MAG TPA: beta-ketoacyl-ACP synthase III [Candidatus Deferrimicrobium sp.]|nr:beta-ketoacyl-ACP synthase III [Candidatus Deferrimicrobium sp.]